VGPGERGAATTFRVADAAAAVDHGAAPEDSNILFLSNSAGLQTPYYSTSSMLPITDDGGSETLSTIGSKRHHNATAGSMNTTSSPSLRLRQLEHLDHPVDEEDCRNSNPMYPVADKRRDSCNTTFRRSGIKADEWHHNNKSSDYKGFGGGMSTASGMSFTNSSVGGAASGFSVQSSNFTNNAGPRPGPRGNKHGQDNMGYSLPPFSPSGHYVNPPPGASMIPFPSFSAGMAMGTSGGMMTNSESASNGPAGRSLQHFGIHPSNSALNTTILPSNNHSTERIDARMQPQCGDQQLQDPWSAVNRDQHIMASNLSNHQAVSHYDYLHQRTDAPVLAMSTCYDAQQPAMIFAQQQANRQQHQQHQQHQQQYQYQQQQHMPNTNGDVVSNPAGILGIYGTATSDEYSNQLLIDPCHPDDNYFTQGVATNPSTLSYYQTMQSQDNNNNDGPNMPIGKPPFPEFQQRDTVGVPSHDDDTAPDQSEVEHFSSRKILTLEVDGDSVWLSHFLCFLRRNCCEVFIANKKDVNERRTSKKIKVNQVGIRCRFCAHQPRSERAGRSSCYPSSVARIYQSVTMMIREHYPVCDEFPEDVRKQYTNLKKSTQLNNWVGSGYLETFLLALFTRT
jgi:type II secretory pathway pseudopilin PulG